MGQENTRACEECRQLTVTAELVIGGVMRADLFDSLLSEDVFEELRGSAVFIQMAAGRSERVKGRVQSRARQVDFSEAARPESGRCGSHFPSFLDW